MEILIQLFITIIQQVHLGNSDLYITGISPINEWEGTIVYRLYKDGNMIYNSDSVGAYNIMRIYKKEKGVAIAMPIKGLSNPRVINVSV